ncbi:hypothetical protein HII31_12770, partial [Pseudocercospora fuligena]
MSFLPKIRHGPHLVRRAKRVHELLVFARRDRRCFSRTVIYRDNVITASYETSGSLQPIWSKDAPHGTREQQTAGQLDTDHEIVMTQKKPRTSISEGRAYFDAYLSQEMQDVLGFHVHLVSCAMRDTHKLCYGQSEEAMKQTAVQEFDKACRLSGQQGLSSLAIGAAHLGKVLSPNLSMTMRKRRPKTCRFWIEAPGPSTWHAYL